MNNRFFSQKKHELTFEWNAASQYDWPIIRRNFVAAYISAYKDQPIALLNQTHLQKATKEWDDAFQEGFESVQELIILPVAFYFAHEKNPFENELRKLASHFGGAENDIGAIRDYFIKLQTIRYFFEEEFAEEKHKIDEQNEKIDYLVVRFHDRPIAFFACQENYKSSQIYLRWVTMEPAFQRKGLGHLVMEDIAKHYPEAIGMELYTRKANVSAQGFYKSCGFKPARAFDFVEKGLIGGSRHILHLPSSDAVSSTDAFVAFSKPITPIRRVI